MTGYLCTGAYLVSGDHRKVTVSKTEKISLRDRKDSFVHAFQGIRVLVKTQHNAWLHAVATLIVCSAGVFFGITPLEWCCLVLCIMTVWAAEAMNTALELLTDLVSPEFHPMAGQVKDVAAGAVLIAAIGSTIVGTIVFGPYLWLMIT